MLVWTQPWASYTVTQTHDAYLLPPLSSSGSEYDSSPGEQLWVRDSTSIPFYFGVSGIQYREPSSYGRDDDVAAFIDPTSLRIFGSVGLIAHTIMSRGEKQIPHGV